jgi:UDP-N-acetylmuramate--alanine ligase
MIAIVTNIDNDHLGTHEGDFERLKSSFVDFLHNLPFYGLSILCLDDATLTSVMHRIARPIMTYGLAGAADVRAVNLRRRGLQTEFDVVRSGTAARDGGGAPLTVLLNLPGVHNVRNALAAIAVATELGIEDVAIVRALGAFQGIDRRLQHVGDVTLPSGTVTIVDDYGHHPTEIAATLDALRQGYPGRRVVLAFQPHRYTRTRDLIDDFGRVLSQADVLLVTEVYSAGEAPIAGADGRAICRAVRSRAQVEPVFVENVETLGRALQGMIRGGDVVLTMGAGNINAVSHGLPALLSQQVRA